jgi:tetratricopeptide (TPR) repeat protein
VTLALQTIIALVCATSTAGTFTSDTAIREGATYTRAQTCSGNEQVKRPQHESAAGKRYYVRGNGNSYRHPDQAIEYYKLAVENGFDTVDLRIEMGILLRQLKRYEESAEQLRVAVQMDECDVRAHLSLAYTLLAGGAHADALKEFELLKDLDRRDYEDGLLSIYLGDCLYELGRYGEALKEYRRVLSCDCYEDTDADRAKARVQEIERKLKNSSN